MPIHAEWLSATITYIATLGTDYSLGLDFILAPATVRKTRTELMKEIDADYYGYRDEDDGIIVPMEQEQEKQGIFLQNYTLITQ